MWLYLNVIASGDISTSHTPARRTGHKTEYQFGLGISSIEFSTQNKFTGEVKECTVYVTVDDDTPPLAKNCPKGVIRHTDLDRQISIDPMFSDNTGIERIDIGGLPSLPIVPGEYMVTFRALDQHGNIGVCQVNTRHADHAFIFVLYRSRY